MAKGETLAILKFEQAVADEAFDYRGDRYAIPTRTDDTLSLHIEHGLSARYTVQAKLAWTQGEDDIARYDGRGPLELGLRTRLYRDARTAVSLYAGVVLPGEGRNAGYAPPGVGGTDLETRLLAGRSFTVAGKAGFAEVQVARLNRSGLPDETRLDVTLGFEPTADWLLLVQSYEGWAESGARWSKAEVAAVRRFGDWRLQAGWRLAVAGKSGPAEAGPVLGVWRTF